MFRPPSLSGRENRDLSIIFIVFINVNGGVNTI